MVLYIYLWFEVIIILKTIKMLWIKLGLYNDLLELRGPRLELEEAGRYGNCATESQRQGSNTEKELQESVFPLDPY